MLDQKNPSEEGYAGRTKDGKPDGDHEKAEESRQQELENFVQEELYIHGKVSGCDPERLLSCC